MKVTLQVVKMVYINNDNCFNNFSNMTVKNDEVYLQNDFGHFLC